jgi:hypothetical protein
MKQHSYCDPCSIAQITNCIVIIPKICVGPMSRMLLRFVQLNEMLSERVWSSTSRF